MPVSPSTITVRLDRRLLHHPRAFHLRRMRLGIWLYLDLVARLRPGETTLELEPAKAAADLGLSEGTVRSWLGHLNAGGYVRTERLNGVVRVTLRDVHPSTPSVVKSARSPRTLSRFFTAAKLEDALGESGQRTALEAALSLYPDPVIRRALAATLAVPGPRIRRSRTALFLYLLKQKNHAQEN
jgi:hypothetical protein